MICIAAEILEEIVLNLPVKAALRFQCVSKSWRFLIGSKQFIKSHLQKSKERAVVVYSEHFLSRRKGLDWLFQKEQIRYLQTPEPSCFPYIMGCCNGLLCVATVKADIFVCNPSTRTFEKLPRIDPEPGSNIGGVGFGWEESTGEYKLLALVDFHASVYSSITNSWKRLDSAQVQIRLRRMCGLQFVCGKFHWLHRSHIASFELKTERFGTIEYPPADYTQFYMSKLGVAEGCLCCTLTCVGLVRNEVPHVEVWVMKQYGVRESWVKLMGVDHPFSVVSPDGDILLLLSSTAVIYCPASNAFRMPRKFHFYDIDHAFLHIESLLSPKVFITDDN